MMTCAKLDAFFSNLLDLPSVAPQDPSQNGLQVERIGYVKKIAFAVDASLESFKRAAAAGAHMLFVHHGLFWRENLPLTGIHRRRIAFLLEHNLALYAVHLPLDLHPRYGNNAALCDALGISPEREKFGRYRGIDIGFRGKLEQPLRIEEAVRRVSFMDRPPVGVYPFGPAESATCAVVSGGAADEIREAIASGTDLYVSGESSHSIYHEALEAGINFIAAGHYNTEVWGVRRVMEACAAELSIDVEFIDIPTGL